MVTGIVVNEKLSIPANYRRKLRQELYYCQKFGIAAHLKQTQSSIPEETYRRQLLGKINYVLQVHPNDSDLLSAKEWLMRCNEQKG